MLRKNLSTEHTEGTDHREFLVASLEILEEIFVKEWPEARNQSSDLRRNLYGNKIFKKNLNRKYARVPRFWEGVLWGSPTARNLN